MKKTFYNHTKKEKAILSGVALLSILLGAQQEATAQDNPKGTAGKPEEIAIQSAKTASPIQQANVPNGIGLGYSQAKNLKPADSLQTLFTNGQVTAHARLYNFQKFHQNYQPEPDIKSGSAIGGDFLYQTGELGGFSGAIAVNTQHVIAPLSPDDNKLYPDYAGRHHTSITQSYIQYKDYGLRFRGGRQLISTPFAAPSTYTMLPRAYYGVTGTIQPLTWIDGVEPSQLSVFLGRITKYESRFSEDFTSGDKYFRDKNLNGFLTAGVNYASPQPILGQQLNARLWYYKFYDIEDLYFADGETVVNSIGNKVHPLIGFQAAYGTDTGKSLLGRVDGEFYGLKLGLSYPNGQLALVGTYAPVNKNSYENGGLATPYGRIQNNGGVFTATMNNGNIDIGPGYGYGIKAKQSLLDGNLKLYANYIRLVARYGFGGNVHYNTGTTVTGISGFPEGGDPVRNQHQQSFGLGFKLNLGQFDESLKHLTIQDQFNFQTYRHAPRSYNENRLRVVYTFE